jgi:hypothetical protein
MIFVAINGRGLKVEEEVMSWNTSREKCQLFILAELNSKGHIYFMDGRI